MINKTEAEKIDTFTVDCKCFYKTPISNIILHGIPPTGKTCGIYKICFGDYFYIGQSFNILNRIETHVRVINKHYNERSFKVKPTQKVMDCIDRDKNLKEVNVHLLEACGIFKLATAEYRWLRKHILDDKCLNSVYDMRHSPSFFKNPIKIGSQELKFDLATKEQIKLYKKFLVDLKYLKKNNL